jgi:hypothetical protein
MQYMQGCLFKAIRLARLATPLLVNIGAKFGLEKGTVVE